MMTRRCAARAGAGSACSPPRDCLVSLGASAASGNSSICRNGQAGCGGAIGHSHRCRHRSIERSPLSGPPGTEPGVRELIVGGTPYVVLYRVRGKKNYNPHHLARSATKKSLIQNRNFQNKNQWRRRPAGGFCARRRIARPPARRRSATRPHSQILITATKQCHSMSPSRQPAMNGRS